jgi:transposase InsO family protein
VLWQVGLALSGATGACLAQRLGSEFYYLNKFRDLDELHAELKDYIHYYNHDRIKLKLGGMSPVAYRAQFAQA